MAVAQPTPALAGEVRWGKTPQCGVLREARLRYLVQWPSPKELGWPGFSPNSNGVPTLRDSFSCVRSPIQLIVKIFLSQQQPRRVVLPHSASHLCSSQNPTRYRLRVLHKAMQKALGWNPDQVIDSGERNYSSSLPLSVP